MLGEKGSAKADARSCLEVRDFQILLTVAEAGSFRRASSRIGVGQSALSRRIQRLEDTLGVSLFERHPTGARLTLAGAAFAKRVRAVISDLDAAIDAAHIAGMGRIGKLNVGIISSLSRGTLRDIVREYVLDHPNVKVTFAEADRGELLTLLSHRRLDVVLASGRFPRIHGDSTVVSEEPIYIALQTADPLAKRSRLSWGDVRGADFLVSATEPGPEIHEYLIQRLADLGHRPNVTHHRLGREGIMSLVGLGFGVSLVAEHWCGVRYPGVVFRLVGTPDEKVPFSLVWRPENDNPALRRFVSLARVHARKAASSPSAASQSRDPSP